jgi:hypothetical protein
MNLFASLFFNNSFQQRFSACKYHRSRTLTGTLKFLCLIKIRERFAASSVTFACMCPHETGHRLKRVAGNKSIV